MQHDSKSIRRMPLTVTYPTVIWVGFTIYSSRTARFTNFMDPSASRTFVVPLGRILAISYGDLIKLLALIKYLLLSS